VSWLVGKASLDKGKRGERELAAYLNERGFKSRRGRQYHGDPSAPDVISTLPFHIECKRTEALSLYPVIEKAQADAGNQPAVIFHRRNNKPWLTILTATDFLDLMKRLQQ
jgi:Holliday junction resolvase